MAFPRPAPEESEELDLEPDPHSRSPRHGFQGDRAPAPPAPTVPASLTIAISREAGSRGGSIARRVGVKLGWQIYTQDLLEYIAQEGSLHQDMVQAISDEGVRWANDRFEKLLREQNLSQHPSVGNMARIILALGAQGEAILLGRGAGSILPPESTLNVRIYAPLEDRVAYMSQWLRLTVDEAADQVRLRDARRAQFLETHFHRSPGDVYHYDLLLSSSLLGEELCADLIARAARAKLANRTEASFHPSDL